MPLINYIALAVTYTTHTYGHGEVKCGDPESPVACEVGAVTASGVPFDPDMALVAVHIPPEVTHKYRIRPGRWHVCLMHREGFPVWLPVLDKKGAKGLDATPAAVRLLGYEPTPTWSAQLTPCPGKFVRDAKPRSVSPINVTQRD